MKAIEEAILSKRIFNVDIAELDTHGLASLACCGVEKESNTVPVWTSMAANRAYATEYVWQGDALLSADLRILLYHSPMHEVAVPKTVRVIGKYAFYEQEVLEKVILPSNLEVIDESAFANCSNLRSVDFPSSLKYLGQGAFCSCSLSEIVIPNGVAVIPEACFSNSQIHSDIIIPPSVKRIGAWAFENCTDEVFLPEGVETIEAHCFGNIHFLHVPASLTEISPEFYLSDDLDGGVPFVNVAEDNPLFYDIKGTLYKRGCGSPYLGKEFEPQHEPSFLNPQSGFSREKECTLAELQERYTQVHPIDSHQQLFHVWNGIEQYFNIVDRFGNEYFDKSVVKDVIFSFDHFVIANHSAVYSIDMNDLFMDASLLEYDITNCDPEGRIYVMTGYEVDDFYAPLFPNSPLPQYWCIDVCGQQLTKNIYNGLQPFDVDGFAPAAIGKKWGMIDTDENVVLPFEYNKVGYFDPRGMALVARGTKKGYVNRAGELVIPFRYNFFYKEFGSDDYAYAEIYKGKDQGGYFVDRQGNALGRFQPEDKHEHIYSPGFHLFIHDGKYGYCRQFARDFSGCIFKAIRRISDNCIEVTADGRNYTQAKC